MFCSENSHRIFFLCSNRQAERSKEIENEGRRGVMEVKIQKMKENKQGVREMWNMVYSLI